MTVLIHQLQKFLFMKVKRYAKLSLIVSEIVLVHKLKIVMWRRETGTCFLVGTIRIPRINYRAKSRSPLRADITRGTIASHDISLWKPIKYCMAVCYNTSYAFLHPSSSIYRHLRCPLHQRFSFSFTSI